MDALSFVVLRTLLKIDNVDSNGQIVNKRYQNIDLCKVYKECSPGLWRVFGPQLENVSVENIFVQPVDERATLFKISVLVKPLLRYFRSSRFAVTVCNIGVQSRNLLKCSMRRHKSYLMLSGYSNECACPKVAFQNMIT